MRGIFTGLPYLDACNNAPMGPLGVNILRAIRFSLNPMTSFLKKGKLSSPSLGNPKLKQFSQQFSYRNFYGFSRDPFDPQPDPRLIFLTEKVGEVWSSILSGITREKRFLLLTGEKGMGKTTLISLIYLYLATKSSKVNVVPIFDSPKKMEEILQRLLRGLGCSPIEESKSRMLFQLEQVLAKGMAREGTVTLIIDEAQNLRRETLEEIRLLANPTPKIPSPLQEIFVGDPQFEEKLRFRDLVSLNQRIEVRCRLSPFTPEESLGYIEHRLNIAGGTTSGIFTPRAVSLIAQAARGNPGNLNRICRETLFLGYSQSLKRIDPANVREALGNLRKVHGSPAFCSLMGGTRNKQPPPTWNADENMA
jgi:general secretion pathway protein A